MAQIDSLLDKKEASWSNMCTKCKLDQKYQNVSLCKDSWLLIVNKSGCQCFHIMAEDMSQD